MWFFEATLAVNQTAFDLKAIKLVSNPTASNATTIFSIKMTIHLDRLS